MEGSVQYTIPTSSNRILILRTEKEFRDRITEYICYQRPTVRINLDILIENGTPVDNDRVARYIVWAGNVELLNYFLFVTKADLTTRDVRGRSAIFYAVIQRNFSMLKYVAKTVGYSDFRAQVNRHDVYGLTPLHCATMVASLDYAVFCFTWGARGFQSDPNLSGGLLSSAKDNSQAEWMSRLLDLKFQLKWGYAYQFTGLIRASTKILKTKPDHIEARMSSINLETYSGLIPTDWLYWQGRQVALISAAYESLDSSYFPVHIYSILGVEQKYTQTTVVQMQDVLWQRDVRGYPSSAQVPWVAERKRLTWVEIPCAYVS
jgi:hypothetical protein